MIHWLNIVCTASCFFASKQAFIFLFVNLFTYYLSLFLHIFHALILQEKDAKYYLFIFLSMTIQAHERFPDERSERCYYNRRNEVEILNKEISMIHNWMRTICYLLSLKNFPPFYSMNSKTHNSTTCLHPNGDSGFHSWAQPPSQIHFGPTSPSILARPTPPWPSYRIPFPSPFLSKGSNRQASGEQSPPSRKGQI